jgi:CHAT domain-containing protein/Tfp pilus assembly protein PilF
MQDGKVILIFFVAIVGLCFCLNFLSAEENREEEILTEIIDAAAHGEETLREFIKKNNGRITQKVIKEMAETGFEEREKILIDMALFAAQQKGEEKNIADVYLFQAKYLYFTGKYKKSKEVYEKVLTICEKYNDWSGQGKAYSGLGDVYFKFCENPMALSMYDKALSYFVKTNEWSGQGDVYWGMGNVYFYTGQLDQAMKNYKKALDLFKKRKDLQGLAKVYRCIGDYYGGVVEKKKSFKMYKKALKYGKMAKDLIEQGSAYKGLGGFYRFTDNDKKTLKLYEKAMALFKKVKSPLHLGSLYWSIGEIYRYEGNYKKALEIYKKALALFLEMDGPGGMGYTYWSMGTIYRISGDYGKELETYEKVLSLFKKIGDPRGMGNTYHSMGNIYLRMGNNIKALEMFNKALALYMKTGNPLEQAKTYRSIGDFYFEINDDSMAMEMYKKALSRFEKADNPLGQSNTYMSIGDLFRRKGNYLHALNMYKRARFFYEAVNILHSFGVSSSKMGEMHLKLGDNLKAFEMYEEALRIYKKIGAVENEAIVLNKKANLFKMTGRKKEAVKLYEEGISRLERVRSQVYFSEMKRNYLQRVINHYENAVLFMLQNQYPSKAFYYTEAMKARSFLDQLAEGLVKLEKGIEPGLKTKQDILINRLSILNSQILRETRKLGESSKLDDLKKELKKVEAELDDIKRKIRFKNPLYVSVRYPQPITVPQLQQKVLKKNEVILEYFISKNDVYCFVITSKIFRVKKLNLSKEVLESKVKSFRDHIISFQTRDRTVRKEMEQLALQLYESLLAPFDEVVKGKILIIIPDGILAVLPFEALKVKQGKDIYFLAEKYRVKYVQSASVLNILRTHYKKKDRGKKFIGFGDPVYDYFDFTGNKNESKTISPKIKKDSYRVMIFRSQFEKKSGTFSRLEQSGNEVKEIGDIFQAKQSQAKTLLRLKAREEETKGDKLTDYGYIHFSAHGILDDKFQAIVLSQIPGASEDGFLTIDEIMNCRYNARLVVLSACNTGLGIIERGEGVTGLTRAVMYAGTPAVIASLWAVDDNATKELMVRFYRYMLEENLSKEEALRKAKLDLIKSEKHASPAYWSAFVMYGE